MSFTEEIKSKAFELGFDIVGITDTSPIDSEQVTKFQSWLESGFAGQMSYMHRNFDKRINPSQLLENAQSIIIVGLNYNREPVRYNRTLHTVKIASYACYEDYHTFIKQRLRKLTDFINEYRVTRDKRRATMKICVDSVPLAERALAARAGLGFIGKNHMLINPELGCKIFLGEIITDLKLEYDETSCHFERSPQGTKSRNLSEVTCSYCQKCIEVCPTGALQPDGMFDARKCINYLTIEYKGEISTELAEKIGDKLFGCEECIDVCPHQEKASECKNKQFNFYPERVQINHDDVLNMSEELFEAKFGDSVIYRTGLDALKRNARICLTNRTSS